MRILNGLKFSNGLKVVFAMVTTLVILAGTANADINIDSQVIPSADISSISIEPLTGDMNISTFSPFYTVTKNSGTPPPPGAVVINSFIASPATILEGQSTTLSWTTANAVSCTPTGGTGGWSGQSIAIPNGSSSAITIASAGSYTFTLSCNGSGTDTDTRNASVTVNAPPTPSTCSAATLSGSVVSWANLWKVPFPQPGYDNRNDTVASSGYKAYEFFTGTSTGAPIIDDGKLVSVGNTSTTGIRLGAISECEGDFQVENACKHAWGIGGGIDWSTRTSAGANECKLKTNTTYYFNVTFTDGVNSNTSTCSGTPCRITLQHVNL